MLIVQKFGGSSLDGQSRVLGAARLAAEAVEAGHRVVVVVSAQGKTTDKLLQSAPHRENRRELDALLATGEQQSAAIMAMTLTGMGYPAVSLTGWQAGLVTDEAGGDAHILGMESDRIVRELDRGKIVVVTGFQGVTADGEITTLGRGGSDTTAVALAAFLKADACRIYTDVDGVYDKDPRVFSDAVRYDRLDYETMLHMARSGARVLHDRCVELAQKHGVKIRVLSTFRPGPGTVVE